jgi:hypothetical protein
MELNNFFMPAVNQHDAVPADKKYVALAPMKVLWPVLWKPKIDIFGSGSSYLQALTINVRQLLCHNMFLHGIISVFIKVF